MAGLPSSIVKDTSWCKRKTKYFVYDFFLEYALEGDLFQLKSKKHFWDKRSQYEHSVWWEQQALLFGNKLL